MLRLGAKQAGNYLLVVKQNSKPFAAAKAGIEARVKRCHQECKRCAASLVVAQHSDFNTTERQQLASHIETEALLL